MKASLGALLALLLASVARAQDQRPSPILEQGDNYILNFSESQDEQLPLLDFVKLAQEATGFNFTYDPGTAQLLQGAKVVMLGTKVIPKSEFYNFFQIQLFINDFVCLEVGPPQIRVILIQSLATAGQARGGGSALGKNPTFVAPQDLSAYVDQPAQLIITVLNFKNIDTRQLQTQLRQLLVDQTGSQQVVPAGERSLIMQGFGSYVASLANLLTLVDDTSATTASVQPVFDLIPLEFAAAEDVADLLEQLLEAQQESINRRPRPQAIEGQGVSSLLPGTELESKILVDARTNSLLVMALPEEMPRIKDLVARLDVDVIEPERNFHVYKLQNVKAGELSEVLDEFLSGAENLSGTPAGGTGGRPEGGGGGNQGGGGGASARTSNEVIVVPDEMANALLIAANKTRYEEVLELIRQLDVRQDQVLIESALIELTGADFRDIGVEWAFADSTEDGGFGVTGFGLSTLDDTDGDGSPDTRIPLSPTQGLVAGILSGDDVNLPLLLSAAQRTTGANVLNVPSVLVNNNGSARVVTLDQQPTTQVTASGAGNQTQENFAGYQDAGITLEISPSISASRYLRLDISLIVSNFTGSFSSASTIPPPRVTREMKTTVNVPDGDTMVIGGVISDTEQKTRIGMPWLADLPLVGALFRRDSDTNSRTTLYFFVTPHILRDPDFADLSEISYQKKLSAAEIMGKDRVRMVDPDFGASDSVIDFGSFQVPLYRAEESGEIEAGELGIDPLRGQELLRESREGDETPPGPEPEPEPEPSEPEGAEEPDADGSR
jgi:general secretion pathway protein D